METVLSIIAAISMLLGIVGYIWGIVVAFQKGRWCNCIPGHDVARELHAAYPDPSSCCYWNIDSFGLELKNGNREKY